MSRENLEFQAFRWSQSARFLRLSLHCQQRQSFHTCCAYTIENLDQVRIGGMRIRLDLKCPLWMARETALDPLRQFRGTDRTHSEVHVTMVGDCHDE